MGTPDIGRIMLEQLLQDGYCIVGVLTQPDRKVGRKQVLHMSSVKQAALSHGIPVYQPTKIRDEYKSLLDIPVDLIVTCAYGQFIPQEVLEYPTYGSINVHASLLPKLRGGAPIHKAILYGHTETGISIMRMVEKMDAGDVMAQCRVPIDDRDTTGTLFDKMAVAGAKLLSTSIPAIFDGSAVFVKQKEEDATFAYAITKEEEYISFHKGVKDVYNHIRALLPSPAGYSLLAGKKMKFHKVGMVDKTHAYQTGEVIGLVKEGLAVAAIDGIIIIEELQMEGKSIVHAKQFYNGAGKHMIGKVFQ